VIDFEIKHPRVTQEVLGYLPGFLSVNDPRPAREQLAAAYGWSPFAGFTMTERGLEYPGDPTMPLLAEAKLRDEVVRLYDCSWVAIVQPDGSYEIARMD
jgi:hypothetical protein